MDHTARALLDRVRRREPRALAELATIHGRLLVGVAFTVLQNLPASERAAARAIADCWSGGDAWPSDPRQLRGGLLGAAARAALRAHAEVSEVDPTPRPGAAMLLRLNPQQRAVAALRALGGLSEDEAVTALRPLAGSRDIPDDPSQATAGAVRANVAGLPVTLTTDAVLRAIETPPLARRRIGRWALAATGGVAAAAFLLVLAATPPAPGPEDGAATAASGADSSPAAPRPKVLRLERPAGAPLTLADCGIGPPETELAFQGWITPRRLGVSTADLDPGHAVLALVPISEVAWNPPGGPRLMPPVRGRMACLSNAADGTLIVVGLPAGWTPPTRVPAFPGGPIEGPDGGPRPSDTG